MSLELSIFQRLLKEAILSQSEFLDKVSQTYTDRDRLPDDKILAKLLELIDETQILSLAGKANKKNRKKVENFIDDQVKAMTAEGESSVSIKDIRKLYDGIIQYLAPSVTGEKKSDVSFDQCIRYTDIFLKSIYPNLSPVEKARVDSGDFSYGEVFSLVLDFQSVRKDKPLDVEVIYEDDAIKIVYPLDPQSFIEYVLANKPDILWKAPWCTLSPAMWAAYHSSYNYVTVAYVKEHYKKDHSHSLISLKLSDKGEVNYRETCDYYNKRMNENLKEYLSDECLKECKSYILSLAEKTKEKINTYSDDLDTLVRLGDYEEFANRLMYISNNEHLTRDSKPLQKKIKKSLWTSPKDFFSNVFLEFVSNIDIINYDTTKINGHFLYDYMRDILSKDVKGDRKIFNLLFEKACKKNINPRYAHSFITITSFIRSLIDSRTFFLYFLSPIREKFHLIVSNSLNTNNPTYFNNLVYNIINLLDIAKFSKEEQDKIIKRIFLSKSYISFYKENFEEIKEGEESAFIYDNFEVFTKCYEEITRKAETELLNIGEVAKDLALQKIQLECHRIVYLEVNNIKDTRSEYENSILNTFSELNEKYNTSITLEEFLSSYNNWMTVQIELLIVIFDNNSDEFLNKNLNKFFVETMINYFNRNKKHISIKQNQTCNDIFDRIVGIFLRVNRSDILEKLFKVIEDILKSFNINDIGHLIYTSVFGTNMNFDKLEPDFAIKNPGMASLYKIPGFKRKLQNRIIASCHEDIFKIIFTYSIKYKNVLTDNLFEDQIKFIKEKFNFPAFINLLKEFFVKEENGQFQALSDEQKARMKAIIKQYLNLDVFKKYSSEEPEELVKDYVKTQL